MSELVIGRIVHYSEQDVTAPEPVDGQPWPTREWPAIIVQVDDAAQQIVTLRTVETANPSLLHSLVPYDAGGAWRTWHWPTDVHTTTGG